MNAEKVQVQSVSRPRHLSADKPLKPTKIRNHIKQVIKKDIPAEVNILTQSETKVQEPIRQIVKAETHSRVAALSQTESKSEQNTNQKIEPNTPEQILPPPETAAEPKLAEISNTGPARYETKLEPIKDQKFETVAGEQSSAPPETKVDSKLIARSVLNEKPETETSKQEHFEPLDLTLTQRLEAMVKKEEEEEEEPAESSSNSKCLHYLGYLKQRTKGEVIPEECIECSQSIECLLSEPNSSKESLKEIKKWYTIKLSH